MLGISIDEAIKTKIAFLSEKEIVIGKAVDVAIALRTAQKKFKSIIENRTMESLINVVPTDAMIWFAGLDQTVLDKAPVPVPAGASNRSIRGITGSFTLTNAVSGNVVIHTTDSVSAGAINKLYSKLGTVTRLIEGPAGLKWLAEGLSAKLDGTQINLSLNYPVDTLENLRNWSDFPVSEAEVGIKFTDKALAENDMVAPVELLKRRPPAYPEKARSAGISGSVILRCIIRPDGIPDKIEILNGLGYGLDESAVNTVLSKYRFIPAILNGKPVSMAAEIKIDFRPF
jgi:TonB family protein